MIYSGMHRNIQVGEVFNTEGGWNGLLVSRKVSSIVIKNLLLTATWVVFFHLICLLVLYLLKLHPSTQYNRPPSTPTRNNNPIRNTTSPPSSTTCTNGISRSLRSYQHRPPPHAYTLPRFLLHQNECLISANRLGQEY